MAQSESESWATASIDELSDSRPGFLQSTIEVYTSLLEKVSTFPIKYIDRSTQYNKAMWINQIDDKEIRFAYFRANGIPVLLVYFITPTGILSKVDIQYLLSGEVNKPIDKHNGAVFAVDCTLKVFNLSVLYSKKIHSMGILNKVVQCINTYTNITQESEMERLIHSSLCKIPTSKPLTKITPIQYLQVGYTSNALQIGDMPIEGYRPAVVYCRFEGFNN